MDAAHLTTFDHRDLTDPIVFGSWYQEHWDRAVALARRWTGDVTVAEDVAADALVRCWQRWQVAGAPDQPWAYLAMAIRNGAASHFRRRDRDEQRTVLVERPADVQPEAAVDDRQHVDQLLQLLPAHERATVVLHYLEDLAGPEIAAQLSVAPATVRSHLRRARRRLAASAAA